MRAPPGPGTAVSGPGSDHEPHLCRLNIHQTRARGIMEIKFNLVTLNPIQF